MNHDIISKTEFIQALKNYRARHNFTQEEAARNLEMPVRSLQNWEIARSMPRGFALVALLKAIGFIPAKSQAQPSTISKLTKKASSKHPAPHAVKKKLQESAPKSLSTHLL